jgi:hypothetical protein
MSDAETTRVTYVELAKARGISVAAARRLTQRHKWPKQIGNDGFTRVIVPTSMLVAWDSDAYDDSRVSGNDACDDVDVNGEVSQADVGVDATDDAYIDTYDDITRPRKSAVDLTTVRAIVDATADAWADLWDDATADTRSAVRVLEAAVVSLREQLATERLLRAEDKERADCAEQHAREAETRVKEVQDQLQAEMVEHRRVVGMLAEQLSARRSWWPWWRR